MKTLKINIIALLLIMVSITSLVAQAPQKMTYQAVVRDANDDLLTSTSIGIQISILENAASGTAVYVETQNVSSNANALISLEIGAGLVVSGDFATIDWSNANYFVKTELDPNGGTNYTISGSSQLLSVPYALYANNSGSSTAGPQGPPGVQGIPGSQGIQGVAGTQGPQGLQGPISATSAGDNILVTGTGTVGDPYIIEAVMDEVDGDTTNEIQDLQIAGNLLSITNNGTATIIDLTPYLDNTDTQLTEAQVDAFANNNGYLLTEVDGSITNEIQTLTRTGDSISLSDGGTVAILDGDTTHWKENANGIHYNTNGFVGIGISTPVYQFHRQDSLTDLKSFSSYSSVIGGSSPGLAYRNSYANISGTDGTNIGIQGTSWGISTGFNQGLVGWASEANINQGVVGFAIDSNINVTGFNQGLVGEASNSSFSNIGIAGYAQNGNTVNGVSYGVVGIASSITGNTNTGIYAEASNGATNFAGQFVGDVVINGNLNVTGNIAKGAGTFKIDHPLDPANKYLVHSFVESPEMLNVYSGNVTTDGSKEAIVVLPDYFEASNKEYRYQLTVIGTFAQAIVLKEISANTFVVATDAPNVKVSWEVTAVRADKYADENRIIPELEKEEKGTYLHPELYKVSKEKGVNFKHLNPAMINPNKSGSVIQGK